MELKDLTGKHELSGVDTSTMKKTSFWGDEEVNVVLFIIDGVTYKAVEDPDDGYRSYLDSLYITSEKVSNIFPPQGVIGKMRDDGDYEVNDVIDFIDVITGLLVLSIGTENTDDYYPYCTLDWMPQNLAINNQGHE